MLDLIDRKKNMTILGYRLKIVFQFMNNIRTSYVMTKGPVMHFRDETEHLSL